MHLWELYRHLIPGGRIVLTCLSDETLAFQKAGLKKTKAEQQKKFPLKYISMKLLLIVYVQLTIGHPIQLDFTGLVLTQKVR